MEHSYCVASGAVELRPLAETELEVMRQLRNKYQHMFVYSNEITPEEQRIWYARYLKTPGDYIFSVYFANHWIGSVSIYNISGAEAEFGRLFIDKAVAGRGGLGVDATKAACDVAFRVLGITTLRLVVFCDNSAAQIAYLKAGFLPISLTRQADGRGLLHMERQASQYFLS